MPLEIERKYLHIDFATLRPALVALGGRCQGKHFEGNLVFALDPQKYAGCLLRLRTQIWPDGKKKYVLTWKTPPQRDSTSFKIREEKNVHIDDGQAMLSILTDLGYALQARYEKVREVWFVKNTEIDLDTLPFAEVLEIEGTEEQIDLLADKLNLKRFPVSIQSYHELHQEWLRMHNLRPCLSFTFEAQKRESWWQTL